MSFKIKHLMRSGKIILIGLVIYIVQNCNPVPPEKAEWPAITRETKPWTRWWWHGNAQTKEGITIEMEAYQKAGIGGLEITPIYGVYGFEKQFVNYLSPEWMELLIHTLAEAERLNMGIDMATGTGWPFGGPWVNDEDACKNIEYKVYELKEGQMFSEKIEFIQQPFLRAVGNLIYEVHEGATTEERLTHGTTKEPAMRVDPKKIDIKKLAQPISANTNLQELALDQVKFERPLALQALMGYSDSGEVVNLIDKVGKDGTLNWTASKGNWKLYAVFEGWHGKMVERAGPGGEGNVIDHFSSVALKNYLNRFDSAFKGRNIKSLRAFFNDSYEVDDARGSADWTPTLFEEFKKRKGYDLRDHLPALFNKDEKEKNERVLSDYRETISEMVLNNFTMQWKSWAHGKEAVVRNQAHGSPSNILDLYAAVDIPEIEGIEPLRIKMASSAGNVTGKKLVSSESATWLNEHFESNLGDIKSAVDRFLLNGVNHIFYHGTCYCPPGEPWPGWLFYAAVHLNPRNPMWDDFDALNEYIARCQSLLQQSHADNDLLVYFPIYDRFAIAGNEMVEHFDGVGKQFENTAFRTSAELLFEKGYSFDFISDKQIENIKFESKRLKTEGGNQYKTILIPQCNYIPVKTLEKVVSLAEQGATVIFFKGLPKSFAGFGNFEENKTRFEELTGKLGEGNVKAGEDIEQLLQQSGVDRESVVDAGLQYIRKITPGGQREYFIANSKDVEFSGWVPLQRKTSAVVFFDPMTGKIGKGKVRSNEKGNSEVYLQLESKQSIFIRMTDDNVESDEFQFIEPAGVPLALNGTWSITFTQGGPELPPGIKTDSLKSWTLFQDDAYQSFSGTAVYSIGFNKPKQASPFWLLDLGRVKESAEIILNGKPIGTLIGPSYRVAIPDSLMNDSNVLEVKVSNLMANRIVDLDKRNIFWKKFYNVNFPARKPENRVHGLFNASQWSPKESGLLGRVRLYAVTLK